ncbi:hypothetical protein [Enhygromyxa salina]|uniref:Tetratricopeptide repeat protein n=1 Tax=Enhygromyxa salina TaxID=215803 RepID=A0A2S9YY64_9BACT|nr:hypothetical protein [Enhygromyxa salina]PRQ10030.1 hypothetical protein ENSA7_02360 [Enhygromyxa salina]
MLQLLVPLSLLLAPSQATPIQVDAELQMAIDNAMGEDRQAAIAALESAIELHAQSPDAASLKPSESVLEARVILIRLHLVQGETQAAQAAMDDLIRTARDQAPPVRSYGPEVTELYEARKAALQAAGTATLEFDCEVACERIINERKSTSDREPLLLGSYRVWVKAAQPGADWVYHDVELAVPGAVKTIGYADPNPADVALPPPPPPEEAPKRRMLPRGAEIAGLTAGVGLLVAGAVLLSFDQKCSASKQPLTPDTTMEACGDSVYETTAAGASLLGVGGGLLVVSGVLLGVDEVRVGRAKGRQVTLGIALRF